MDFLKRYYKFIIHLLFFAGDLGGSSVHDDVGDSDSKNRDGLPNSPSSSGGFCQFSSKGVYREDMSDQRYFAGNMELYMQDMFCYLPQESVLSLCRDAVVLGTFISDEVVPAIVKI